MTSIDRLYVQTLGQELPPEDTGDVYEAKVERLRGLVAGADAVVVGIGSGMSTAAGYDFYHRDPRVDERLGAFQRAHGFATLFEGLYHIFGSNEEQWAFNAAVTELVSKLPFWDMVARNPEAFYAQVDHGETTTPAQLGDRALVVTADLARVMNDLA